MMCRDCGGSGVLTYMPDLPAEYCPACDGVGWVAILVDESPGPEGPDAPDDVAGLFVDLGGEG